MKTKVLILASLLLVASASSALAGGKGREASKLSELVKKEIAYPEFARDMKLSGIVDIFVVKGEEGPEVVATSSDPELRLYVEERVSAIEDELVKALEKEQTSRYRLTFRYVR